MEIAWINGDYHNVSVYGGIEIDNTNAQERDTLFVVGNITMNRLLSCVNHAKEQFEKEVKHIVFGASNSVRAINNETYGIISQLLEDKSVVDHITLEVPVTLLTQSLDDYCQYANFNLKITTPSLDNMNRLLRQDNVFLKVGRDCFFVGEQTREENQYYAIMRENGALIYSKPRNYEQVVREVEQNILKRHRLYADDMPSDQTKKFIDDLRAKYDNEAEEEAWQSIMKVNGMNSKKVEETPMRMVPRYTDEDHIEEIEDRVAEEESYDDFDPHSLDRQNNEIELLLKNTQIMEDEESDRQAIWDKAEEFAANANIPILNKEEIDSLLDIQVTEDELNASGYWHNPDNKGKNVDTYTGKPIRRR